MSGTREAAEPVPVTFWRDINTDAMQIARGQVARPPAADNVPVLDGQPVEASDFVSATVAGFEHTYRLLLARRSALLAPDGVLARFATQRVRFIFRHTSLYAAALERGLHPNYLRDGVARSIELDVLARPLLALEERPDMWPLLAAERDALERMDVPLFAARADERCLRMPSGTVVHDCFPLSAYGEAVRRLQSLCDADLAVQSELVRAAFAASAARGLSAHIAAGAPGLSERPRSGRARGGRRALQALALAQGRDVATALRTSALRSDDGREATWVGIGYQPAARRCGLQPSTATLLDGYAGRAVFLAALECVSGGAGFRELALAALAPLGEHRVALERATSLRKSVDVGVCTGLGSAVYALLVAGELLGEPALVDEARATARFLAGQDARRDCSLDVVAGTAGAVLALLALHARTGDPEALEAAVVRGTSMLDRAGVDAASGRRAWTSRGGRVEAGHAHGESGVALALARLARASGDDRFRAAALDAVAAERCALDDPEEFARAERASAWSHGATGIGLARLGVLEALGPAGGGADIESDLEQAVALARHHLRAGADSLGCGIMGRVEFLLAAAEYTGDAVLADEARDAAWEVAWRRAESGAYHTGWGAFGGAVGLLLGDAGVAYGLLRTAWPGDVPPLLSWSAARSDGSALG